MNNAEFGKAKDLAQTAMVGDEECIAARAVLALSYLWDGYGDQWMAECERLIEMTPESELDHLWMAYALPLYNSQRTSELLEGAGMKGHSPVGLFLARNQSLDSRRRRTESRTRERSIA